MTLIFVLVGLITIALNMFINEAKRFVRVKRAYDAIDEELEIWGL